MLRCTRSACNRLVQGRAYGARDGGVGRWGRGELGGFSRFPTLRRASVPSRRGRPHRATVTRSVRASRKQIAQPVLPVSYEARRRGGSPLPAPPRSPLPAPPRSPLPAPPRSPLPASHPPLGPRSPPSPRSPLPAPHPASVPAPPWSPLPAPRPASVPAPAPPLGS
jgi:hypothetical protein